MPYEAVPGTTWAYRFWLFVVCICSTIGLVAILDPSLSWMLRFPLLLALAHSYASAGIEFRAAYRRRSLKSA